MTWKRGWKISTVVGIAVRLSMMTGALAVLARRAQQLHSARAHRKELLRLAACDDHVLADIGLTRPEIDAALSAPFWDDPTLRLGRRRGELKADGRCRTGAKTARESEQPAVTSSQLILAACNRRRLPIAPIYFAGR